MALSCRRRAGARARSQEWVPRGCHGNGSWLKEGGIRGSGGPALLDGFQEQQPSPPSPRGSIPCQLLTWNPLV